MLGSGHFAVPSGGHTGELRPRPRRISKVKPRRLTRAKQRQKPALEGVGSHHWASWKTPGGAQRSAVAGRDQTPRVL